MTWRSDGPGAAVVLIQSRTEIIAGPLGRSPSRPPGVPALHHLSMVQAKARLGRKTTARVGEDGDLASVFIFTWYFIFNPNFYPAAGSSRYGLSSRVSTREM